MNSTPTDLSEITGLLDEQTKAPTPIPQEQSSPQTDSRQTEREIAALKYLLGAADSVSGPEFAALGKMRKFSAGTYALMQETFNEWLFAPDSSQIRNRAMATLEWLYIHAGPEAEVRKMAFRPPDEWRASVLAWADRTNGGGDSLLTPSMLDAVAGVIEATLDAKRAVDFTIAPRPSTPGAKPDTPPPNA